MKSFKIKISILFLIVVLGFTSCHDQDYYQTNPNLPSNTTPALLLTNICVETFNTYPLGPAYAARYLTYYERPDPNVNYGWTLGSFGEYNTLRQVKKMEELAIKSNDQNFIGLAKFFRAVLFSRLTERFGDVPYSQALQAQEGIDKPVYDSQEDIYTGILKDLEEANNLLDISKGNIAGDVIFGNNILAWKKATNVFRLRTLIHLSKKVGNTKINVKEQFSAVVSDPVKYPLMKDNKDNAQLVYNNTATNNYYPTFNDLSLKSLVSIEEGIAKILIDRQDPRLFSWAEPIGTLPANNFANYLGVNAGLIISDQQNIAPMASKINNRFHSSTTNEPMILVGFSEQEFLIAEAIARGWITGPGTAAGHYNTGIRASIQFYGIGGITIEGYLGKPMVKYNEATGLESIALQKYISMFAQNDWEPFYEQRRTGIPVFNVGPATLNGGIIPKRWIYPQTEVDVNKDNMQAAVARQFGGINDVNGQMWILK